MRIRIGASIMHVDGRVHAPGSGGAPINAMKVSSIPGGHATSASSSMGREVGAHVGADDRGGRLRPRVRCSAPHRRTEMRCRLADSRSARIMPISCVHARRTAAWKTLADCRGSSIGDSTTVHQRHAMQRAAHPCRVSRPRLSSRTSLSSCSRSRTRGGTASTRSSARRGTEFRRCPSAHDSASLLLPPAARPNGDPEMARSAGDRCDGS